MSVSHILNLWQLNCSWKIIWYHHLFSLPSLSILLYTLPTPHSHFTTPPWKFYCTVPYVVRHTYKNNWCWHTLIQTNLLTNQPKVPVVSCYFCVTCFASSFSPLTGNLGGNPNSVISRFNLSAQAWRNKSEFCQCKDKLMIAVKCKNHVVCSLVKHYYKEVKWNLTQ